MPNSQPRSGRTTAELERLRAELKLTMAHSSEMIARMDALLAETQFPALDETSDGLFHSRSRPRLKLPPEAPTNVANPEELGGACQ